MDDTDGSSFEDVIALPRPTKDDRMSARRERVDIFHELTQPSGSHWHEIVAPCELQADVNCGDPGYIRNQRTPNTSLRIQQSGITSGRLTDVEPDEPSLRARMRPEAGLEITPLRRRACGDGDGL